MTDNGTCYIARRPSSAELVDTAITHTRTKTFRPQTNGKVERYNRTLLNEWAYARPYRSEAARTRALDKWLHMYNHHRHHTAIGGPPSQSRQQPGGAEHLGEDQRLYVIARAYGLHVVTATGRPWMWQRASLRRGPTGCPPPPRMAPYTTTP